MPPKKLTFESSWQIENQSGASLKSMKFCRFENNSLAEIESARLAFADTPQNQWVDFHLPGRGRDRYVLDSPRNTDTVRFILANSNRDGLRRQPDHFHGDVGIQTHGCT